MSLTNALSLRAHVDYAAIAAEGHPLLKRVTRREDWAGNMLVSPVVTNGPSARPGVLNWVSQRACDYEVVRAAHETDLVLRVRQAAVVFGNRLAMSLFVATVPKRCGYGAGYDYDAPKIGSLEDWVPWQAPTAMDNWRGVNRSVDVPRLAGQRLVVSGMPPEEAFLEADARAEIEGSDEAPYYMHPATYERLPKCARRSTIVQDAACPEDVVWRLPDGCLSLVSCGGAPHVLDLDGNSVIRVSRNPHEDAPPDYTGALEVRLRFYGNTVLQNAAHVVQIRGLELQKPVSVSVPAQLSADSCDPYEVRTGYWMQKSGSVTVVSAANNVTQATTVVPAEDIVCRNKTCGKKCDAGSKKCWNCELAF